MTARSPLVSIAMPVFNGGKDLRLAVQSIIEQTFEDWELLIIDDGSVDDAVAGLLQQGDPRIRVFVDGLNKGLAARLNEAIGMARGRYFARMDHDDVAHPERLVRQVAFLEENREVDLLGTRCLAMNDEDAIIGELPGAISHADICYRPWLGFYLAHPSWMGRIEWFRTHLYAMPAPFRCEDQELLLRAYASSQFHALAEPLLAYRVRQRPRLATLARTRVALLNAQLRYFGGRGQFVYAGLSLMAFLARVAGDAIFPGQRMVGPSSDRSKFVAWEQLIKAQRGRAGATPHPR